MSPFDRQGQQGERTGDHLWFGRLELGASTGFPIVHLARNADPSKRAALYQAELTMDNASENIWVSFDLPNESAPSASPDLSQFIGEAQAVTEVRLRVLPCTQCAAYPVELETFRARTSSKYPRRIVSALASGRLSAHHYPAPMRLQARDDVCDGVVRFPYGHQTIGVEARRQCSFAATPSSGALARTRQWSRRVAERLVGAPAIALKVTKALLATTETRSSV